MHRTLARPQRRKAARALSLAWAVTSLLVFGGPRPEARATVAASAWAGVPAAARLSARDVAALRPWFDALRRLEAGLLREPVRTVQLGDSHTAAGVYPRRLRAAFQRPGDRRGPGLLPLQRAGRRGVEGVTWTRSAGWTLCGRGRRGRCGPGVPLGLGGLALVDSRGAGRLRLDLPSSSGADLRGWKLEVLAELRPGGGALRLRVAGEPERRLPTRRPAGAGSLPGVVAFPIPAGTRRIELVAAGDGPVTLHGVALDPVGPGVAWDVLGIDGATAATPLAWNPEAFVAELRRRSPALVVLGYGSNEAGDENLNQRRYSETLRALLARVRTATPGAACLLVGPLDRARGAGSGSCSSLPGVATVARLQAQAAGQAGCAFWDAQAALGGPGTACRWSARRPALARRDGVHLTRAGYLWLADTLAAALLDGYARSG